MGYPRPGLCRRNYQRDQTLTRSVSALITLSLLNSLLSPRREKGHESIIYTPPPNQLSVLSTLLVHPDFTTRPREPGWSEAATESLLYLRSLLSLVGPLHAKFDEAFRFSSGSRTFRGATPRSESTQSDWDDDDRHGHMPLAGKYGKDSIWTRGQDFFSVVGWAFNCSVLYPNRWRYWKEWLKFMLDVLEADLHERHRLDTESGQEAFPLLQKSLLATYIGQKTGRNTGGLKWITKAIFADGSAGAVSVFQEIWRREHKGVSKNVLNKRKRAAVNIEKGDFGGWLDDDSVYSSQTSEPPTPQKRRVNSGNMGSEDFQALEPAYVESIPLRQRLFSLVSIHKQCSVDSADLLTQDRYPTFVSISPHRRSAFPKSMRVSKTLRGRCRFLYSLHLSTAARPPYASTPRSLYTKGS